MSRDHTLEAILASIDATALPESHTAPLRAAVSALVSDRPNAVDKIQAPLGRALRNPLFPGLWDRCVEDIPGSPAYADLRAAAGAIAALVRAART